MTDNQYGPQKAGEKVKRACPKCGAKPYEKCRVNRPTSLTRSPFRRDYHTER